MRPAQFIVAVSTCSEHFRMNNSSGRRSLWRQSLLAAAAALCFVSCSPADSPPDEGAAPPAVVSPETPTDSATAPVPEGLTAAVMDSSIAPTTAASPPPLTPTGWGPLRIGMTRAEVVAAAGEDARPDAVGGPEPEQCDEFRPGQAPEGMLVMIEQDRLTRVSLSAGTEIVTERGFGVGDPAAEIEEAYGADAVTTPHKYVAAPAEYITVWRTAPGGAEARGLVYEIGADGRVAHIHAGGPSIQYVEGCL